MRRKGRIRIPPSEKRLAAKTRITPKRRSVHSPAERGTHPPLGRRIAAYQNVKHQDAQCQREKDIVGQVKPPGRADRIIESVAQRHDPGPNKQARHIPDPAFGMQEPLHCQVGKPHAHTSGEYMKYACYCGRYQPRNIGQMVQNHEKRHEAFPLKGGVLLFRCHEDLSFLCDWIECLSDDFIVCPGCQVINDEISYAEYDNGSQAAQREQRDIGKVQCRHEFGDHFERSQQMDHRAEKWEEKDSTDLASNGASDLLLAHAHLLHDGKTRFVLVPFRNLLIVNNQNCCNQESHCPDRFR